MKLDLRQVQFVVLFFVLISCINALGQKKNKEKDKPSSLSSKYDKSKNLTTVRVKQFTISRLTQEKEIANNIPLHQMEFEMWFTYFGEELKIPVQEVHLRFHSAASNYVFLRGQQLIVAIDREIEGQDRAFSLGITEYKSIPPKVNTIYEEFMTIEIPVDGLEKMAKASSLELYLGPVAYKFTKEQIGTLREVVTFFHN